MPILLTIPKLENRNFHWLCDFNTCYAQKAKLKDIFADMKFRLLCPTFYYSQAYVSNNTVVTRMLFKAPSHFGETA